MRLIRIAFLLSKTHLAFSSLTYVTDGSAPAVFSLDPSTKTATSTVTNPFTFVQPNGMALSPDGTFAYVADWATNSVYYVNTATNAVTQKVQSLVANGVNGLAISPDAKFAYLTAYFSQAVYYIDVASNQAIQTVQNTFGFGGMSCVAISLDGNFAYATDITTPAVFKINTHTNQVTAKVNGTFSFPIGVTIAPDGSEAYVADSTGKALFFIDTATNIATGIKYPLFNAPYGVAVSPDGSTVYVADPGAQSVFYVDTGTKTVTKQVQIACTAPNWALGTIAISPDGKSLFVVGGNDHTMWQIDVAGGTAIQFSNSTATAFNSPTNPATLPPSIASNIVSGNSRSLANYLNSNAPYITVTRRFASLSQSSLESALQSAAPTRNAFATFASQTGQITMGRVLSDHLRQARWKVPASQNSQELASAEGLLLYKRPKPKPSPTSSPNKSDFSSWVSGFGQFSHESSQHQTPAFYVGTGGAVAGWDYQDAYPHPVGVALAYAYSHLHDQGGWGFSNINQGALATFATFSVDDWYFDAAFWGGYYHTKNIRNVSFPGFFGSAKLTTHGWQFTPHFEASYIRRDAWFCLEPFTSFDWVNCWERKASESGAAPFNMGQKGRYSSLLRTETGLRFEQILSYSWGNVTFMEKGSYAYQKTFHTGTIRAFLIGSPGSFTVSTLTGAQNLGVAEFEILILPKKAVYPYASLTSHAEVGSKYQAYQGTLETGLSF